MFRYIGKDPQTKETIQQVFTTPQEANRHGLKNIDKYPDYRIIFVSEEDVKKIQEVQFYTVETSDVNN
jgi:hypothetical protein